MNSMQKSLLGAGVLAVLANLFFYRAIGATGIALSFLLFNFYILFTSLKKRTSLNVFTGIVEVSSLLFLGLAMIRATPIIQALLLMSSLGCTVLLAYILQSGNRFFSSMRELILLPFVLAGSYLSILVDTLLAYKNERKSLGYLFPTLAGFILGVPIVLILIALFSQADPIFSKTIQDFLDNLSLSNSAFRIIWTLAIFVFLLPWGLLAIKTDLFGSEKTKLPQTLLHPMTIVMSLIGLTLGAFLIIQWPYVFANVAAETDLSKFGVATYSEYVKKGFLEFLAISGFLYSLLWVGLLSLRAKKEKEFHLLSYIQSGVILLFVIFLLSISRRILLYWELHGLSLIRIYGGMFLIWVGFMTATLWARHFKNFRYIVAEVLVTLAFIGFLGIWNAEQFIYAHHPPTVNNTIDIVYLSRLSAEGYEGWKYSLEKSKEIVDRYQTSASLSADDRRNIAYAGVTLGKLTSNYHTLVSKYGTKEEKSHYQTSVFANELPEIRQVANHLQQDLTILSQKGNNATVSAKMYLPAYTSNMEVSALLNDRLPGLRTAASMSAEQVELMPKAARTMANYSDGTCPSYLMYQDPSWTSQSTYCVPGFYLIRQKPTEQTQLLKSLDYLYTWNMTEDNVYHRLKKDILVEDLLETQNKYRILWKKILSQTSEERTVNLDVSFEAPLLDSLD